MPVQLACLCQLRCSAPTNGLLLGTCHGDSDLLAVPPVAHALLGFGDDLGLYNAEPQS